MVITELSFKPLTALRGRGKDEGLSEVEGGVIFRLSSISLSASSPPSYPST